MSTSFLSASFRGVAEHSQDPSLDPRRLNIAEVLLSNIKLGKGRCLPQVGEPGHTLVEPTPEASTTFLWMSELLAYTPFYRGSPCGG